MKLPLRPILSLSPAPASGAILGASLDHWTPDLRPTMKPRNLTRFTKKETTERIQEARNYLADKERIALRVNSSSPLLPFYYNPEADDAFVNAPCLNAAQRDKLENLTLHLSTKAETWHWYGVRLFQRMNATHFVDSIYKHGAPLGDVIEIIYYPCGNRLRTANKVANLWLGTWHHCPLLSWMPVDTGNGSHPIVSAVRLPKYIDLL